jgi:hypothetical protein
MLTVAVLCRIWGFYGGDYKECRFLGCGTVWIYYKPTFRGERVASIFSVEEITRERKSVKLLLTD